MEIDYDKYSIEELFDAYSSVDKEQYPENFSRIKAAIARKQGGNYICPKCNCAGYETSEMYAAQNRFESVMDYETGKFVTVSCLDCGFTELYKRSASTTGSLLDFFIS